MCFIAYHVGVHGLIRYLDIVKSNIQEPVPEFLWLAIWKFVQEWGGYAKHCGTHWSTDLSTPVISRSFLSSTITVWSVRVLKTEKINCHLSLKT